MADKASTEAAGVLGMALAQATLGLIRTKNVISQSELDGLLEGVLANLEHLFDPSDVALQRARIFAERMAASMRQSPTPSEK